MFEDQIPDFFTNETLDDVPSLEEQALTHALAFSQEVYNSKFSDKFLAICDDFRDLFGGPTDDLFDPFGNELDQNELLFDDVSGKIIFTNLPELPQEKEEEEKEEEIPIAIPKTLKRKIPKPKKPTKPPKKPKTTPMNSISIVCGKSHFGFWKTLNKFKCINISPTPIPQKRFKHGGVKVNYWTSVLDWVSNGQENEWHSRGKLEEVYGKEKYHNFRAVIINKANSLKTTPEYPCLPPGSEPFKNTMLIAKFDGNWYFMYWIG
jgi:hypothetical protein